jgi:hypothetical protein
MNDMLKFQRLKEFFTPKRLIIANTLQRVLDGGIYDPDNYEATVEQSYYICSALAKLGRDDKITMRARNLARQFVMAAIYPSYTFEGYISKNYPDFWRHHNEDAIQRQRIAWLKGRIHLLKNPK